MALDPLAGQPVPGDRLADIPALVAAYYELVPDPAVDAQRISFGTSGHRGSALEKSFNRNHILAVTQAVCEYRQQAGITGPVFLGRDSHALSTPAQISAIEVLAGNGIMTFIAAADDLTATPLISFAILEYNRSGTDQADGIVITPSHNPPDDGGFKVNSKWKRPLAIWAMTRAPALDGFFRLKKGEG